MVWECVVSVVRPGFLFCVWWWFPALEYSGLSAVGGKEGGGVLRVVGLYKGIKDCVQKYGLVVV